MVAEKPRALTRCSGLRTLDRLDSALRFDGSVMARPRFPTPGSGGQRVKTQRRLRLLPRPALTLPHGRSADHADLTLRIPPIRPQGVGGRSLRCRRHHLCFEAFEGPRFTAATIASSISTWRADRTTGAVDGRLPVIRSRSAVASGARNGDAVISRAMKLVTLRPSASADRLERSDTTTLDAMKDRASRCIPSASVMQSRRAESTAPLALRDDRIAPVPLAVRSMKQFPQILQFADDEMSGQ
jgi:hypothetical protein